MSELQCVKFGDMAQQITTKVKPKDTTLDTYVGLEHLDTGSLQIKRRGTPQDVIGEKLRVCKGDIIFGKRRVYQRKVAIADFDGICSAHAMVLRPKEDVVNKDFFPFFMQSDQFMERALQISVGSLSPTINWKTLADQEFMLPSLPDQRCIATTFCATEDCIVKGERFHTVAEWAKQVLMRELFSKGIGKTGTHIFKGYGLVPTDWDFKKFSDVVDYQEGPGIMAVDFVKTGVPLIRLVNIQKSIVCIEGCNFLKEEKVDKKWNHFRLQKEDILISSSASTGLVSEIVDEGIGAIAYTGIIRLRPKTDRITREFLKKYVASEHFFKQINMMKTGSVIHHFGPSHLEMMIIPLPSISEQLQIAGILTRCDETIAAARANVEAAKALKMKMINEMLGVGIK